MRRNIILRCKFVIYERMVCFMEMTNIKNFIFDIGGVLLEYRWADMLMDHGLSRENAIAIGNTMFNDPLWSGMDLAAAERSSPLSKHTVRNTRHTVIRSPGSLTTANICMYPEKMSGSGYIL